MNKTILLVLLAFIGLSTANAQVGIGTTSPDASAELDLSANDKGFLPPRMSTAERNVINGGNPAEGLVIYNSDINCLQWWDGSVWYNACDGTSSGIIPGNTTCETATISATPCSEVPGASLNDDAGTVDGIEYDWSGATGNMSGGSTRALVEIGGQCWFRRNTISKPTAPIADDPNTGANIWTNTTQPDNGYWGYYNTTTTNGSAGWRTTEPAPGEGLLYQWSAAMNNSTAERAQGVCPTGWHVPSDCEFKFLENSLGMSIPEQNSGIGRNSGSVGTKLKPGGSSGFNGSLVGRRNSSGNFTSRTNDTYYYLSTTSGVSAVFRVLSSAEVGVRRSISVNSIAQSVRCLKD